MEYASLETDLSQLNKDRCYLLKGASVSLAAALDSHGIPFIALGDNTLGLGKACQGEGSTGFTNLEVLPKNWEFVEEDKACWLKTLATLVNKDDGQEERFVYGEVLIPETVDAHGDTISEALVRKTSHDYMADYQTVGLQHRRNVSNRVSILESYIAPTDFEIAGAKIRKGTWLMGVRVHDDGLWDNIKKGDITGFSIGGWGRREAIT